MPFDPDRRANESLIYKLENFSFNHWRFEITAKSIFILLRIFLVDGVAGIGKTTA